MREFSLTEVLTMDRAAYHQGAQGEVLCFRPEQQVAEKDPIIEATWPSESQSTSRRYLEVTHTRSGYWLARPASVPDNGFPLREMFLLPLVPDAGWTHGADCHCGACCD